MNFKNSVVSTPLISGGGGFLALTLIALAVLVALVVFRRRLRAGEWKPGVVVASLVLVGGLVAVAGSTVTVKSEYSNDIAIENIGQKYAGLGWMALVHKDGDTRLRGMFMKNLLVEYVYKEDPQTHEPFLYKVASSDEIPDPTFFETSDGAR